MKLKIFALAIYAVVLLTLVPPLWARPAAAIAIYLWQLGIVADYAAPSLGTAIWMLPITLSFALFGAWGIWKISR